MSRNSTKAITDLYADISFGGGGGSSGGSDSSGTGSGSNYDSGIGGSVDLGLTPEQQDVNRDYAATGIAAVTGTATGLGVTAATRNPYAGAAAGAMVGRGTYDALAPD